MSNNLDQARKPLLEALNAGGFDDHVCSRLFYPAETVSATIWLRRDSGETEALKAWRCRYSDLLGPTKGGIRFHPDVSLEEVMALAFRMTMKCAVMGLPLGGGKGAVAVDAKSLSQAELERLARGYADAFEHVVGADRDIPAPDMYTNGPVIAWMLDQWLKHKPGRNLAVVTGKPVILGGSEGRTDATGRGGFYVLQEWQKRQSWTPSDVRVAIQGFGNAARHFARLAAEAGYRIIAVSDSSKAVSNPEGLDLDALEKHKDDEGRLAGAPHAQESDPDELLLMDCDLLVPAALGGQITADNAGDVRAGTILELANGPVTPEADETLAERDVTVIPDILANAGGVSVSYFEWMQNRQGDIWEAEQVRSRLKALMEKRACQVFDQAEKRDLTLRTAAHLLAAERLEEAALARYGG